MDNPQPSARELIVLRCLLAGKRSKEIAEELGVTTRTIESYRMNLRMRFGVHNTAALIREATKRGFLTMKEPVDGPDGPDLPEYADYDTAPHAEVLSETF